jgi:hypothetical protein
MSKEKKTIEEGVGKTGETIQKIAKAFEKGVAKGMKKTDGTIEKDVKSVAKKLRRQSRESQRRRKIK